MREEVLILTTGGTIDKVYFDGDSRYQVGTPQIAEILKTVNIELTYRVETLFRKDSVDLTPEDRAIINRRVQEANSQRIVITHGTDTMVTTAKELTAVHDKTIVLVGSLTPARFKSTDAEFNIGFALAAVQTLPAGVYITMNGCIFNPWHVRKNTKRNRFEAKQS